MLHPTKRLEEPGTVSAPSKHLRKSAGALVCALAALPMNALALCDDSLFCTAIGTGALSSNTTGNANTASGYDALFSNTTGNNNTASGLQALYSNTTGNNNTASGRNALRSNTTGSSNTASGLLALYSNTTGSRNTASGHEALLANTVGLRNVAVGNGALKGNTNGNDNIALGNFAGSAPVTGVNNIHIGHAGDAGETKVIRLGRQGTQVKTFIAGIHGVPVSGAAVVVSSTGQLGVVSSSRRYKENIQPMADASVALMKLKPVTFRYKEADEQGQKPVQFGLIAEEVAEVLPELVVRDDKGQPETVAYHVLPSLLLNEYQKQQVKLADVTANAEQDHAKLADVDARSSQELAQLRDALAARDKEHAAMRADHDKELTAIHTEMKALRQVTQQLMAAMPNATTVGMTEQ